MGDGKNRICPVEIAGSLDSRFRRWIQNPRKILSPYINEGMTVLDLGCGPGFFSVDIAKMVGNAGRVIASDLQEGMLEKLRDKIQGTDIEKRVILHKCQKNAIGVSEKVDFVLAFYMVHEVSNRGEFFNQVASVLKPDGKELVVEPPFHVSKKAFEETIRTARAAGFIPVDGPKVFLSKTVLFKKTDEANSTDV
jgi:ubiquinone/menaquinone biosynthesis C-methylase UbiE